MNKMVVLPAVKPGAVFIFAGSDYLEPDTPEINIKAAISAAIHFGGY